MFLLLSLEASAYRVPGKNNNSSHAIPFRRHDRRQNAHAISDIAKHAGPVDTNGWVECFRM